MGSDIIRPESQEEFPDSSPEVDFALVLSRMIDSVKNDPEHLRATVYELARHKLKEQLKTESFAESRKLTKSLEVAIKGVEQFSRNDPHSVVALPKSGASEDPPQGLPPLQIQPIEPAIHAEFHEPAFGRKQLLPLKMARRLVVVVLIVVSAIVVVKLQGRTLQAMLGETARRTGFAPATTPVASRAPERPSTAVEHAAPVDPLVPATYGIYAISQGKLFELEQLPGRAPDLRVAVSAAIQTPSRTTLPDGRVRFIIYRRDSASNAADRADLRVIAKIEQEMSFDASGKPLVSKVADNWVMRNISIPYRTAPKKDNLDMYEVLSENSDAALPPGRYGLVLKGQVYDFTVAGTITDPRQCLERMAATNGQFYSQCQKP